MRHWKKLQGLTKQEASSLRRQPRGKLYADEDIEDAVVTFLREKKINIISARELGHNGKPDAFHAALAFREKRFLLTKNAKHYLDDRKFPFNRTHGVIVIDGDLSNTDAYNEVLSQVMGISRYGESYFGMKIRLAAGETTLYGIDSHGRKFAHRIKDEGHDVYEWVDD